jgi:hypothetical protein
LTYKLEYIWGVGYSWFGDLAEEDDASDYDSMFLLAGMDTIAPGPQLPLPPMEPPLISRDSPPGQRTNGQNVSTEQIGLENFTPGVMYPGAQVYTTDRNGIQSCKVPSIEFREACTLDLVAIVHIFQKKLASCAGKQRAQKYKIIAHLTRQCQCQDWSCTLGCGIHWN